MYFRDKVDKIIVERLCDRGKDIIEVKEEDFNQLSANLTPLINYFARERKVQGFTEEDFKSFMFLKLHQVLRRGLYDAKRSRYRFFIKTFNNLITDINRVKNKWIKEMDEDALDTCCAFADPHASLLTDRRQKS
jgi:hypothetical protein